MKNLPPPLFKEYSRMPQVPLPPPVHLSSSLLSGLSKRFSSRNFESTEVPPLEELSALLQYGFGLKELREVSEEDARLGTKRFTLFYPSGGGRYPLETYLVVREGNNPPPGLYHYHPLKHRLEKLLPQEETSVHMKGLLTYKFSQQAPLLILVTAVWHRNFIKYRDFGYATILLEAGHSSQNTLLTAAALGINACPLNGFRYDETCALLDIDGIIEAPVHAIAFGKKIVSGQQTHQNQPNTSEEPELG